MSDTLIEELTPRVFTVPWVTHEITNKHMADELIADCLVSGMVAVDTETTGLIHCKDRAFMAIFSPDLTSAWACWNAVLVNYIMEKVQHLKLIFHNFKFDAHMMANAGMWNPEDYTSLDIEDTVIMGRILFAQQGNFDLKTFSAQFCEPGIDVDGPQKAVFEWFAWDLKRRQAEKRRLKGKWIVDKDKHYDQVPKHIMFPYATQDTALTIRTYLGVMKHVNETSEYGNDAAKQRIDRLWAKYQKEMMLLKLLVHAENHGWHMNREQLVERQLKAQAEMEPLLKEFNDIAPGVDIFSSKQLSKYVYETLNEPVKHLTKKGNPSTDESALSDLTDHPEIGALMVRIRQWKKLKDKCDECVTFILDDDAVHSDLKIGGARTGRMSSANPALQNIFNFKSIATGWDTDQPWTWFRDLFQPEEGYEWLLGDYSQIEMRVLAHYSKDENMMHSFINGLDLHKQTAKAMFGVETPTKMQRSFGKVMNFTISYGGGKRRITDALRFGSAQCDAVPIDDARRALLGFVPEPTDEMLADPYPHLAAELYAAYRKQFPAVLDLKRGVESVASQRGYIINAFGREILVPRLESHKALNYLIQGSAADLMKEAMVRAWEACVDYAKQHGLRLWKDIALFMSIHDELIFKCPIGHAEGLARAIRPALIDWPQFRVPIEVDFAHVPQGGSWALKKGLELAA